MITIAIIGCGLIGTSIGMALRNAEDDSAPLGPITVIGYDHDSHNTSEARGRLAIDQIARNMDDAVRSADLVVVAVPPGVIQTVFRELSTRVRPGTVITDVTSTKRQVMEWAQQILPANVDFIGGHPMAGRERSGPQSADPQLFQGAVYCLTFTPTNREHAVTLVEAMVKQIGAKPYYIDPVEHDHYVAGISHLPFMLSAVLMETTSQSQGWTEMSPLAASGFRDMTRLAAGDVIMHRDICLTNRDALIRWINESIHTLHTMRDHLETADETAITSFFEHAAHAREVWLASKPHLRPGEEQFERIDQLIDERPGLFGRMFGGPRRERRK